MPFVNRREASPLQPEPIPAPYDPWIERLAWLMDSSIGIGRWTIGIDPLLGLVPGLGDVAGALISLLIVARAVRAGVPRVAVARMLANVVIDAGIGAIPFAGDIFDFAYKANVKNVRIYQRTVERAPGGNLRHWGFFALLSLGVLAVLVVPIWLVVALFHLLH